MRVWRELDEWLRHRLRAIPLKHWKRPKAIYRELKGLGASEDVANPVAGNCYRWWRNGDGAIKRVLTIAYFWPAGSAQAVMTSNSRTARYGPARRVVWRGCIPSGRPTMPIAIDISNCFYSVLFSCTGGQPFPAGSARRPKPNELAVGFFRGRHSQSCSSASGDADSR
jgi:RNA-directed DNA polymerase